MHYSRTVLFVSFTRHGVTRITFLTFLAMAPVELLSSINTRWIERNKEKNSFFVDTKIDREKKLLALLFCLLLVFPLCTELLSTKAPHLL